MIRRILLLLTTVLLLIAIVGGGFVYWLLAGDGVRYALERQASAWLGQPVHIASARPRLFPRPGLHLEKVEVGDPVRLTLGTIDVSSDGRALLSRQIDKASVLVANSRIEMPLPFSIPDSRPGSAERSRQSAEQSRQSTGGAIQLISIESIGLRDVVVASRGHELTVSADSALKGSRLILSDFSARTGNTALQAEGEIDLAPRVDARLKVKANRLDVDELLALAAAFAPPTAPTSSSSRKDPVRIAARVSAENASAGGVHVRQLATDFEIDGTRVSLSPLTFQLFGGRYQGSLTATLRDRMTATLKSRVMDIDVAQLAEFGGSPGSMTGRLTGAGTFTGTGSDFAGVLNSAHGDGSATIADGSVKHLELVRTVVLFFGRPAPDATPASNTFQRIDATFSLANRLITAQALSLHSNDADIVGNGTLALDAKTLNGRVDMSLSEALTAQAGTDLARYTREGNRIVLPASIGGTLDRPRIAVDAAAAVQRGLRNEVQRRLGGLLDRFKRGQTQSEP